MFKALFSGIRSLLSWRPRAQDPPPNTSPDDSYAQKVMAYIPADIIAAWVAVSGILAQSNSTIPHWLSWAVFGGLFVLTPFYVCYLKTTPPGLTSNKLFHWITSCLAFASWVFALGGPFSTLSWYEPIYGSLLLVFVTLVIPVMERRFIKGSGTGGTGSGGGTSSGSGGTTPPANNTPPNK
jgi:hypothetical protein